MSRIPILTVPSTRTQCDPFFAIQPTNTYFLLRNRNRPDTNFIEASITKLGYFHYNVSNDPNDGLGCSGSWLFEQAWSYFIGTGTTIKGIRGDWTFGTNLNTINQLTQNDQMTLLEAVQHPNLWAFQKASSKGYTQVQILDSTGTQGNYLTIDVVYLN